ncbi:T9SS type A sorting domain-containing protein [bacterium]|nr:T9SS type A sorting domain-containing protein [bacterium]
MKKLIFSILGVLVATIAIQAQTILTSQSFESGPSTGWSYTTNPAAFSVGTDIWDTVTTLSSVTTMPTDATHFWGVQDLANGNGGTATGDSGTISFASYTIPANTNVSVSFDYDVVGFDAGDDVDYEVFENGTSKGIVNLVVGGTGGISSSGTESISITAGTDSVSIKLYVTQNGGTDYAGFDNFKVTSVPACCPITAAPTPTNDSSDVISVYSDAYTDIVGTDFNPNWGQSTVVDQTVKIQGNNTIKYSNLNYQGIALAGSNDVSAMDYLHVDIWSKSSTALKLFAISSGPVEVSYTVAVPTTGWLSLDIPLSAFGAVNMADLIQFKFDGNGEFWMDNLFFYKVPQASTPAPDPTRAASDVISIYSDAYTDIAGTDFNPNWGQSTVVDQTVKIQGNNTIKYSNLNYQGIALAGSNDVSAMEYLHVDIWSATSTTLNLFMISTGPVEVSYTVAVPTTGWLSLDIPLSAFGAVNMADLIQFKFDGNGEFWMDNLYLYKLPTYSIGTVSTTDSLGMPDSLDLDCYVAGTVFTGDYDGNEGISFYMMDNTGGINVFNRRDVSDYVVSDGDSILVKGSIKNYYGLLELVADSIIVLDSNKTYAAAKVVSTLDASTESEFIELKSVHLADASQWPASGNSNVDIITQTGDTLIMRIDGDAGIDSISPGCQFNITGVGAQYDRSSPYTSGYQIFPRKATDIKNVNSVIDQTVANISDDGGDISWTSITGASSWNIGWAKGMASIAPTDSVMGITTNPYTISGLSADTNTHYHVWIQDVCGQNMGQWDGPVMFSADVTSIDELASGRVLIAFPNPNNVGSVRLNRVTDVIIRNLLGQPIIVKTNTDEIDINELSSGVYLLEAAEGDTIKLIVE